MQPLCFVLMPFGTKTDGNKKEINFDIVYASFIKPAIEAAGLTAIRADAEKEGGFIHKPMYERLLFCSFAVADLSFDNANVFYELGIRHAVRAQTTVVIFEKNTKLSFDVGPLRAFPYEFTDNAVTGLPDQINSLAALIKVNIDADKAQMDSPIGQLIPNYQFPDLEGLKEDADCFADWVKSTSDVKDRLANELKNWKQCGAANDAAGMQRCIDNVRAIEQEQGKNVRLDYDVLYVFLKTYRSMDAFTEIIRLLTPVVKGPYQDNIYLQQQLAMAHYKCGEFEDAEQFLLAVIEKYGAEPETNGLLGSVYKSMSDANSKDELLQEQYRSKAIQAYLAGFESDPRYFYPGINALTLMFLGPQPDERFAKFMPLVSYSVERLLATKEKDYWTQATALELAVLAMNPLDARKYLGAALFCSPDGWMKKTTAANLQRIYARAVQGKDPANLDWIKDIITRLK